MKEISTALSEPPEGVIAGESIPRENEQAGWEETDIQRVVGLLKTHESYHSLSNRALRRKAIEILQTQEN